MSETGKLEAIWLKRARGGPMDPVSEASIEANGGLVGDANFGRSNRQVTVIEKEVFDALRDDLDAGADPTLRRANLMVSGVRLAESRDRVLRIGGCRVRIRGETRPCNLMEEQLPGLQDALDPGWRGGVFGNVLDTADIKVGDAVSWEEEGAGTPDSITSPTRETP